MLFGTAAELASLAGLCALEARTRAERGDHRDRDRIVDDILAEASCPDLRAVNERVARMIAWREQYDHQDGA